MTMMIRSTTPQMSPRKSFAPVLMDQRSNAICDSVVEVLSV